MFPFSNYQHRHPQSIPMFHHTQIAQRHVHRVDKNSMMITNAGVDERQVWKV